uniref:Uncharacterized protein n=1 Tax=Sphaerodactylus townsendi TaxID=933632 RepID=A0ACB8FIZ3_9SAUR
MSPAHPEEEEESCLHRKRKGWEKSVEGAAGQARRLDLRREECLQGRSGAYAGQVTGHLRNRHLPSSGEGSGYRCLETLTRRGGQRRPRGGGMPFVAKHRAALRASGESSECQGRQRTQRGAYPGQAIPVMEAQQPSGSSNGGQPGKAKRGSAATSQQHDTAEESRACTGRERGERPRRQCGSTGGCRTAFWGVPLFPALCALGSPRLCHAADWSLQNLASFFLPSRSPQKALRQQWG